MNSKFYKYCAVPQCKSTTTKTPNKLFIYVPHKDKIRKKWLSLARRDPSGFCHGTRIYFCEDHFDLPRDMENYMKYYITGSVARITIRPGCVPTKFECQPGREKQTCDDSNHTLQKIKHRMIIEECLVEPAGNNTLSSESKSSGLTSSSNKTPNLKPTYETTAKTNIQGILPIEYTKTAVNCTTTIVKEEPEENDFDCDQSDFETQKLKINERLHKGLKCKTCYGEIVGYRYTCVQCADYDLCSACEASGVHPHHYVLRVPGPRPQIEIKTVLDSIRWQLNSLELPFTDQHCRDNEIRVKTETRDDKEESDDYVINDFISTEAEEGGQQDETDPLSVVQTQIDSSPVDKLFALRPNKQTVENFASDEALDNVEVTRRLKTRMKEKPIRKKKMLRTIPAARDMSQPARCGSETPEPIQKIPRTSRILSKSHYRKQSSRLNTRPGRSKTCVNSTPESISIESQRKPKFTNFQKSETLDSSFEHNIINKCIVSLQDITLIPLANTRKVPKS